MVLAAADGGGATNHEGAAARFGPERWFPGRVRVPEITIRVLAPLRHGGLVNPATEAKRETEALR
jgi:hypothetical protein